MAPSGTWRLEELTGQPSGGLVPGPNNTMYLRVLDTASMPQDSVQAYSDAYSNVVWETWEWGVDDGHITATDRPAMAGGIKFFVVADAVYENDSSADFAETTMIRTDNSGESASGVVMPGVPYGILELGRPPQ